ncbi:glutathione S-transferase family protein [Sessilibacter corallicola]|uniref:Glutathione S-transferase n=1 Tax=Sessilibacter corallicola TaxID=2904075 RepID=A0ABQ0ADG8_9GAMM|nr:glutathione S-transferase [Sessilibacter corallicola]MCE2029853.1 glutathione S-transferase [Sessilibacter corallicola]
MKLYDLELSGNCYKVRLFCALTGIDIELIPVDFLAGAHKQSPVIDLNPWGELPVLDDGKVVLRDSQAILVYLANKYEKTQWWPKDPAEQGEIVQWLSVASNEIQNGPCAARLVDKFGMALNKERTIEVSDRILPLVNAHLENNDWLALNRPTIADCAVFPYIGTAWEGGVDISGYTAIVNWIARIKELPGYTSMPGV